MAPARQRRTPPGPGFLALLAIVGLMVPVGVFAAPAVPGPTLELQVVDISDWHGQVVPNGTVGGAAVLKAYFDQVRAQSANNLTLTSGDDVGATPPLSTYFQDTPAILAERMMGIQVGTLGNHNFDSGIARLQRQIDLAASTDPSVPGTPFKYVSANLSNRDANISGVSDYAIFEYKGIKVAVIGITNEEAPGLNFPGSMGTMVPTDSVAAAMAARAAAKAAGANVFVAITHKGVTGGTALNPTGELIDFANGVSGFQLIVGDHTDVQYSATINGQFVIENRSKSATFSTTKLLLHRGTGALLNVTQKFYSPVVANVTPDAGITAMLQPYVTQLQPILGEVINTSTKFIPRADSCGTSNGRTCESLVGDVISDAMREVYATDFALANSGGIRDALTCGTAAGGSGFCPGGTVPPYSITRGQVLAVLPFGNVGDVIPLNGLELKGMLENAVSRMPAIDGRYAQVSGLCFTYNIEAAVGSRVTAVVRQAADGSCTGAAVDLTTGSTYTLATNDFVVGGGDGYPVYSDRGATRGVLDQDVAAWIAAQPQLDPVLQGRIVCYDPNPAAGSNCPVPLP